MFVYFYLNISTFLLMSLDIVGGGQVRVAGAVGGGEDGEHVHTELRGEQA